MTNPGGRPPREGNAASWTRCASQRPLKPQACSAGVADPPATAGRGGQDGGHGTHRPVARRTASLGRLNGWHQGPRSEHHVPGHSDRPEDAIAAIKDARLVRALLDQAEHDAVATALRGGRPLSEVAVAAGVTREEAQRRWGDLLPSPDGEHRGNEALM